MTDALWYLTTCSLKNRVRSRLRRLRQPRYLVGAAAGLLYFYVMVFRQSVPLSRITGGQAALIGSLGLFFLTALNWLVPAGKGLMFTPAEVHFLFQAPLSRQQLLHYKLMTVVLAGLFGSAFMTLMFRRTAAAPLFFIGTWLLTTTISVNGIGVSLTRQSLARHGRSGLVRQAIPLLVLAAALVALASAIVPAWPRLVAMTGPRAVMAELQRLTSSGAAGVVFWPFRTLMALPLSTSTLAFLRALPGVLVLLAMSYIWVLRADTAFEEASAARAEKLAELRRSGMFRPTVKKTVASPFRLAGTGRPEFAILWKNLIMLGRYFTVKALIGQAIGIVIVTAAFGFGMHAAGEKVPDVAEALCGMALWVTVLMGPQMVKNDFRRDLSNLAVLKAWPIGGAALVRGEVLAPACVLTGIAWLLVIVTAILASHAPDMSVDRSFNVAGMLLAPGIITIQLILQNAFVLMFPAWMPSATTPAVGMQGMGQRYVTMIGSMLALVVALIPATTIAAVVGVGLYFVTNTVPVVMPALAGAAVLMAECWLATEWLGRRFDRMDISAIDPVE